MMPRLLAILALAAGAGLAGCSGGGASVGTASSPQVAPMTTGGGTLAPQSVSSGGTLSTESTRPRGHDPVIMIPGMTGLTQQMDVMKYNFEQAGWPTNLLFEWTDSSHMEQDLRVAAAELANEVKAVQQQTGHRKVVLATWSASTLAARYYIKNLDGAKNVSVYISLSGPHHGTTFNYCSAYYSCSQFGNANSSFLQDLNAGTEVPGSPRVSYFTARSTGDFNVAPESSAMLKHANVNYEISGPTAPNHFEMPSDPTVFGHLKDFILEVERGTEPRPQP